MAETTLVYGDARWWMNWIWKTRCFYKRNQRKL